LKKFCSGKKNKITKSNLVHIELFIGHPDHWKNSPLFLKQYLMLEEDWNQDMWKLCYEYILLNHFDREIFQLLLGKNQELNNKDFEKKCLALFDLKK